MTPAADVVREFCAAIDRKDLATVEALMDETVVYHNIGAEPAVGREASLAAVKFQFDMFDPISFRPQHRGGRRHGADRACG